MELPIPIEIPWRLAATNQRLLDDGPSDATISLFYYQPQVEGLATLYPDEYLVYLKLVLSICPPRLDDVPLKEAAKTLFAGDLPVWNVLLNLTVTPDPPKNGGIRPFFLAAAPMHRAMIETGVVGNELYEGEAAGLAVGKSASQLHETGSSHAETSTSGTSGDVGWLFGSVGFSTQDTETTTSFDRSVTQRVDTTQREASQERRELLSHRTSVANVLSLLDLKHLGSPYLHFMLRPRPLRPLTLDPSDPNLWYSQLLHRRSSGLEGIQEFFAVVAVPKDTDFCVHAHAMRISVLDDPPRFPDPLQTDFYDSEDLVADFRMLMYLYTTYPPGTPLEELDVDILPDALAKDLPRPVIGTWDVYDSVVAWVRSPHATAQGDAVSHLLNYKHRTEVWLETIRWEYERALAESPLERGEVLNFNTYLNTCFSAEEDGGLSVSKFDSKDPDLKYIDARLILANASTGLLKDATQSTRRRQVRNVAEWNALERRVAGSLSASASRGRPLGQPLDGGRMAGLVLRRWAALAADDPRNRRLDSVGASLGLGAAQRARLQKAHITDLRGLARAINHAQQAADLDADRKKFARRLSKREAALADVRSIAWPVPPGVAGELRRAIAKSLIAS